MTVDKDFWKNNLKNRVPEYYQGDNELAEYLEVCGEIFDDLGDTVRQHDVYKDYKLIEESRLALLAKRFAFQPPAELPASMMRGILRDIGMIHKTRGVEASFIWVFKLLGWDASIRHAWLPEPERYDPTVRELFPSFYLGEGFTGGEVDATYQVKYGDPYKVGDADVLFHADNNFVFDGPIRVGRSPLKFVGIGDAYDPYTPRKNFVPTTDIMKMDYRNFLYGAAETKENGTYFSGSSFFSRVNDATDVRILGENYKESNVIRKELVVASTPYIVIDVDRLDFDRFTQPYIGDDGITYSYTTKETYDIAEILINYLLHSFVRPSNVKVLMIVAKFEEDDTLAIGDVLTQVATAEPQGFQETFTAVDHETTNAVQTYTPVIGDEFLVVGAPTIQLTNSFNGFANNVIGMPLYDGPFVPDTTEFVYSENNTVFTDEGGQFVTRGFELRSPSHLMVTVPSLEQVNIEYKSRTGSDWVVIKTNVTGQAIFESHDIKQVRLVSNVAPVGSVNVNVKWRDQTTLTSTSPTPTLIPISTF